MAQKNVLITINHAPYGNIYYTEGLRAAVGITSGIDENKVTLVYMGDGAYFALKGVDRKDTSKYIGTLEKQGCKLMVERESLLERGIAEKEAAQDVKVIPRSDVLKLIQEADQTIGF
ncbi:MAG TPA: DsrE family protein [Candidatus Brocadiia bacterium]|nr:DsrE family protein [Candidatus Brocadiales bacterium]